MSVRGRHIASLAFAFCFQSLMITSAMELSADDARRNCQNLLSKIKVPIQPFQEVPYRFSVRVSQFGAMKDRIHEELNRDLGKGGWRLGFHYNGQLISYEDALSLYEDSYYYYLMANPDVVEYLINQGSDVYDTNPSNVLSGFDWTKQEGKSSHLQDIAVRRSLSRMNLAFRGTRPLEIRGRNSELYILNPGLVPFVEPTQVLLPTILRRSWIKEGSVEDFWQNNKFVAAASDNRSRLFRYMQAPSSLGLSDDKTVSMSPRQIIEALLQQEKVEDAVDSAFKHFLVDDDFVTLAGSVNPAYFWDFFSKGRKYFRINASQALKVGKIWLDKNFSEIVPRYALTPSLLDPYTANPRDRAMLLNIILSRSEEAASQFWREPQAYGLDPENFLQLLESTPDTALEAAEYGLVGLDIDKMLRQKLFQRLQERKISFFMNGN